VAKKRVARRISRDLRSRILNTARTEGLTAAQVEKKFGVSRWTYYGWRKRGARGRGVTTRGTRTTVVARGTSVGMIRDEVRATLPTILREEIARALAGIFGAAVVARRRRRGRR
jgi:transposase-like protein